MKKVLIGLGGLVVLAIAGFFVYQMFLKPETLLSYTIKKEDVVATLTVTGEVEAKNTQNISSTVSAKILSLSVDDGDRVSKGQLIARLDPVDLNARLAESRANLNQMEASLASAQSTLKEKTDEAHRYEHLYEQELISQQEYQNKATAKNVAEEEVRRLNASIKASRAAINTVSSQFSNFNITSQLNGVVTERIKDPGDIANPGEVIMTLVDPNNIEVIAKIEEMDLARVTVGNSAQVVLDALPEKILTGTITRIGHDVDPEDGTLEAAISIPPQAESISILPGMTADINIITNEIKNAIVVPATALRLENNQAVVYKFNGNKIAQHPVKAKRISLEYFQITDGLNIGDNIARFAQLELLEKNNVTPLATPLNSDKPIQ